MSGTEKSTESSLGATLSLDTVNTFIVVGRIDIAVDISPFKVIIHSALSLQVT